MIVHCSRHSLDRAIEYIHKIKTHKKARRYLISKFKKLCREKEYNGYPIAIYYSSKTAMSITSKGHTFTFKVGEKNNVHIITYHYWTKGQDNLYLKKLKKKDQVYKKIEEIQRNKGIL